MEQQEYDALIDKVVADAAAQGFTLEDLGSFGLDGFWRHTRSQRYLRMVRLAFSRGRVRGLLDVKAARGGLSPTQEAHHLRWLRQDYAEAGIRDEELQDCTMETLDDLTGSKRIRRLLRLGYLRGRGFEIRSVRSAETPIGLR